MPAIWLIDAYRAGERGQVRALAEALGESLGWPVETIELEYRKQVVLPHVAGQSSLRGITAKSRNELQGPWPDLVISCGVRNEPVCRWIRDQSGGKTRYVHVGRPWAALDSFDLVVTTPQYRVPSRDNIVNNQLTLHALSAERLSEAAQGWRDTFEHLPRPWVAIMVGGNSGPFTLGSRAARRLAKRACEMVRESGGSLLVSTSSRTPAAATRELESAIDVPAFFYRWQPDNPDNPYLGMLALADSLVVTGDSIAMLSEACATSKPVYMFDLGGMRPGDRVRRDFRLGGLMYSVLMRCFPKRLSRDITLVHSGLQASGRADWLGSQRPGIQASPVSDMQRAVSAVRDLLGETVPVVGVDQSGAAVD